MVISADEIAPQGILLDAAAGRLASEAEGMRLYDPTSTGSIASEGAVALVIERMSSALRRGANVLAKISGAGLFGSLESGPPGTADAVGRSVREALREARSGVNGIDLVVGCGRGRANYDLAELRGIERTLSSRVLPCPVTALSGVTGVAESASGLFALLGGLMAIERGIAPPVSRRPPRSDGPLEWVGPDLRPGRYGRVLVTGGTDLGLCASVVLEATHVV